MAPRNRVPLAPPAPPSMAGSVVIMDAEESRAATAHAQAQAAARFAPGNYVAAQGAAAAAALARIAEGQPIGPPPVPHGQSRPGMVLVGDVTAEEIDALGAGGQNAPMMQQHHHPAVAQTSAYAVLSYARGGRTRVSRMVGASRDGSWLTDDPTPTLEILSAFGVQVTDLRDEEDDSV